MSSLNKIKVITNKINRLEKKLARINGREVHKIANIRQALIGFACCLELHPERLDACREAMLLERIKEGEELITKSVDYEEYQRNKKNSVTTLAGYYHNLGGHKI